MAWWRKDGPGFQPFGRLRADAWGVAPGWFEDAPLALADSSLDMASIPQISLVVLDPVFP